MIPPFCVASGQVCAGRQLRVEGVFSGRFIEGTKDALARAGAEASTAPSHEKGGGCPQSGQTASGALSP
jgi:hypothetical protein